MRIGASLFGGSKIKMGLPNERHAGVDEAQLLLLPPPERVPGVKELGANHDWVGVVVDRHVQSQSGLDRTLLGSHVVDGLENPRDAATSRDVDRGQRHHGLTKVPVSVTE